MMRRIGFMCLMTLVFVVLCKANGNATLNATVDAYTTRINATQGSLNATIVPTTKGNQTGSATSLTQVTAVVSGLLLLVFIINAQ